MQRKHLVLFSAISLISISTNYSSADDVLRGNQMIRDGNTLVSANTEFQLGFFSPGSSTKRYVAIWFKKISYGTTVWVANRDAPLNNTSGMLRIDNKAVSLVFVNASNNVIWSSNYSRIVKNPVARLLDTGNLKECRGICLKNCTCTAYSNTNIENGGSGCLLWFKELMDISVYTDDGQDIYVRMPASELDESKRSKVKPVLFISVPAVLTVILVLIIMHLIKKKNLNRERRLNINEENNLELPFFEFRRIASATSNFSHDNKIGEGGFGPVYKGMLEDGQQIAVKRLSENSKQGLDEFKNEVSLIAKLQHRNLVSLIGYCVKGRERILIYEYMPNKSLDFFIYDKDMCRLADWPKLYNIINGVARGLLYLHQDSKLRIIHRDLKASNVLLDHEMNPKISDFGMARSFGGSQTEANTTRVVGTYGYMPPEYVIDGIFSTKSDVYSFGVIVIEIVSGMKNRCFEHPDHNLSLLGHAWRCFNEEKLEELIDRTILDPSNQYEVFRVIQIGLLCVQEYPEDRPNMTSVVLMLNSKIALPKPKKPGFFTERKQYAESFSENKPMLSSSNDFSITTIAPR